MSRTLNTPRRAVAYCGPIARAGAPAIGGKEAGNRSIVDLLREKGVRVAEFPYPRADRHGSAPIKMVIYGAGLTALLFRLAVSSRRWDVLHFNGHCRHFIYFEWVFPALARILGKPIVTHIRAGDMRAQYDERSRVYRRVFDWMLRSSDAVAAQGLEDMEFVDRRRPGLAFYLPNFVTEPPRDNLRVLQPGTTIHLVSLGLVAPEKGVEVAIQAKRALDGRGIAARLAIIGAGDPDYVNALKTTSADPGIEWLGAVDHGAVRGAVRGAHVFVFPTAWPGEGHSNALTETMAEGIVPVCSDHGFNRRIVADAGVVLPPGASGSDYADAIAELWNAGSWPAYSRKCVERVRELYTADAVIDKLIGLYETV
jgi:glycosyltransferase involved in cell wall biosynthesis